MSAVRTRRRNLRMCARFGHLAPPRHAGRGFEAYRGDREHLCYWCKRCAGFIDIGTRIDIDAFDRPWSPGKRGETP